MRSNTLRLQQSGTSYGALEIVAERVDRLWNVADYHCRQEFIHGRRVPGYEGLCTFAHTRFKDDYERLPSDIAQEVLKKLAEAWKGFHALNRRFKAGELAHRPGLPKYRKYRDKSYPKDFIPIKTSRSYSISNGLFALTLPADLRSAHRATQGRLLIPFRGKLRYSGKGGRAELRYDKADRLWRVAVSTEVEDKRMPEESCRPQDRAAAIDLGLRISASLTIEGQGKAHHFAGRELMKDYQYWTRRIAAHQQELAARGLVSSRRLSRLYATRSRRLEHGLRSIAKAIAGLCRASGVKVVYIGWPKGIRNDVKVCKDWRGRIHNYWSFGIFSGYLAQSLTKNRILSRRVGERGTSSTCPWTCNPRHHTVRRPRWKLSCRDCDKSMHSDAAGSTTLLAFQKPGTDRDGVKATPALRTHEWDKHSWAIRANRRSSERRLAA